MSHFIRLNLLLICCFCVISGVAQNSVRFEASSDARQVVLGGYFEVVFTLYNAEGKNFNPPDFNNFEVLTGPSESRSVSIINGRSSQSYGLSYNLQPKRIGKFTIGSASVRVDGKTLRTRPIQIEVLKGKNSSASTKEELDQELGEGVFVKAILNKEESKIGEQIVVDYKLYTSRNIESYSVSTESEYPGFFAHEVRRFHGRQIQEVIDGVQYTTKLIKKVALFPQQAGLFIIDPMVMNISVAVGSNRRRSIFSLPKVATFNIETELIEIKVSPLPEPVPPSFSGAVGKFNMRTSVNRNKLTTDDAITLRMYIDGNGDIKQVQPPKLDISDKFEMYDPKVINEENTESNAQLYGRKEFEYLIIPKEPGNYTLTANFSYYDPDSSAYITLNSESFSLTVAKGELNQTQILAQPEQTQKKEDIRYIKTDLSLSRGSSFVGSGFFWILFAFPFLLLGGVIVMRQIEISRGNIDLSELKKKKAIKLAQKRLAQAKTFMDQQDSKSFYDEVSRASFGYVCDKLNIAFSELSKENVRSKLQSLSVAEESIERFMQIVKTCEMTLFAGKDNAAAMKETYGQALEVIAAIEGQVKQPA